MYLPRYLVPRSWRFKAAFWSCVRRAARSETRTADRGRRRHLENPDWPGHAVVTVVRASPESENLVDHGPSPTLRLRPGGGGAYVRCSIAIKSPTVACAKHSQASDGHDQILHLHLNLGCQVGTERASRTSRAAKLVTFPKMRVSNARREVSGAALRHKSHGLLQHEAPSLSQ